MRAVGGPNCFLRWRFTWRVYFRLSPKTLTAFSPGLEIPVSDESGRAATDAGSPEAQVPNASLVTRVNLHELQNGASSENVALKDGDTVFVLRAENIYLFGQVRNPGAYLLHHDTTTVLQGLALAGGVTDRGATSRIEIVRIVKGEQKKIKVDLSAAVLPGDTIVVPELFF